MIDHMAVGQNQWYRFGVGEFTTHFSRDFCGDWDVHWGYDLAFDPWPNACVFFRVSILKPLHKALGLAGGGCPIHLLRAVQSVGFQEVEHQPAELNVNLLIGHVKYWVPQLGALAHPLVLVGRQPPYEGRLPKKLVPLF